MKKLVEDWLFFANNDLAAAEVLSDHLRGNRPLMCSPENE